MLLGNPFIINFYCMDASSYLDQLEFRVSYLRGPFWRLSDGDKYLYLVGCGELVALQNSRFGYLAGSAEGEETLQRFNGAVLDGVNFLAQRGFDVNGIIPGLRLVSQETAEALASTQRERLGSLRVDGRRFVRRRPFV